MYKGQRNRGGQQNRTAPNGRGKNDTAKQQAVRQDALNRDSACNVAPGNSQNYNTNHGNRPPDRNNAGFQSQFKDNQYENYKRDSRNSNYNDDGNRRTSDNDGNRRRMPDKDSNWKRTPDKDRNAGTLNTVEGRRQYLEDTGFCDPIRSNQPELQYHNIQPYPAQMGGYQIPPWNNFGDRFLHPGLPVMMPFQNNYGIGRFPFNGTYSGVDNARYAIPNEIHRNEMQMIEYGRNQTNYNEPSTSMNVNRQGRGGKNAGRNRGRQTNPNEVRPSALQISQQGRDQFMNIASSSPVRGATVGGRDNPADVGRARESMQEIYNIQAAEYATRNREKELKHLQEKMLRYRFVSSFDVGYRISDNFARGNSEERERMVGKLQEEYNKQSKDYFKQVKEIEEKKEAVQRARKHEEFDRSTISRGAMAGFRLGSDCAPNRNTGTIPKQRSASYSHEVEDGNTEALPKKRRDNCSYQERPVGESELLKKAVDMLARPNSQQDPFTRSLSIACNNEDSTEHSNVMSSPVNTGGETEEISVEAKPKPRRAYRRRTIRWMDRNGVYRRVNIKKLGLKPRTRIELQK